MAEYDPHDETAQTQQRQGAAAREKNQVHTEVEDVRWLMGSKRGRRIVRGVMSRGGLFRPSFNTNSMTMAFAEGAKCEAAHWQKVILDNCPEHFTTMLKEAIE
jgi:hypothetical protein